ncbi:MAG TPA: galactokinase [Terracidiphilus sp.]|nr:galactokinase [Terracidiphilus sp.]
MQDPEKLKALHRERFGAEPKVFVAPGRVNLIGEHTDYAEGFVMPAAIDFATLAGISPRSDGKVTIRAENYGEERVYEAGALPKTRSRDWSDYPVGVLKMLEADFPPAHRDDPSLRSGAMNGAQLRVGSDGRRIPGLSLTLWGDVPLGAGLSSSAAVEVATAIAVADLVGAKYTGQEMARLCQRAENQFVGSACGIMDQFVSVNAREGHALLLDCRDLSYRLAPIPPDVALVIANTMVKHAVTGGEYTSRRAEVEEAAAAIARHRPEVKFLRDATMEDLERWGGEMSENARKRARHVITENQRTVAAADALIRKDLRELGLLMAEAHRSYSRDFEASCDECDTMVELAQDLPGLIGARLTGGGFGGCTVNLVAAGQAEGFRVALAERYRARTGIDPQILICHASAGAHRLE